MATMTAVGCGSAFNKADGQANFRIIGESGKTMIIDCGSYFWQFAAKKNLAPKDVDAVYISHLHADHVGGLEELAFCTYFAKLPRPKLYANATLMRELWEESLRGGLASIQGKVVTLTEYFDCMAIPDNDEFEWDGLCFTPVQSVHVMAGYMVKHSFGLMIENKQRIFFTSDAQFCPNQIRDFYDKADVIIQDCETSPYKSGVHAHYDELKTLPEKTRQKMWMYHYQPNPPQMSECQKDGFAGFITENWKLEI